MIIAVKSYVFESFDVFHQVFAASLLGHLQSYKRYYLFSVKVLSAKHVHHVVLCRD